MAITTADGVIAGAIAGGAPVFINKGVTGNRTTSRIYSTWQVTGVPGPGNMDTTLNGVVLDSSSAQVPGQIPFRHPGGGSKCYLGRLVMQNGLGGGLILADRIWHNGGLSPTSIVAQNITTPTWPARDDLGGTDGVGVMVGLEVSATTGAGTPTLNLVYTSSDNNSSRNGFGTLGTSATTAAQTFFPIGLAQGDRGVKSIQSFRLGSTWTSGTINLVAYRVIAMLPCGSASIPAEINALTGAMIELHPGTVPFLLDLAPGNSTTTMFGCLNYLHG